VAPRLRQLGPKEATDAHRFCQERPDASVFLAGWLADGGLERRIRGARAWMFADVDEEGRIRGLVYISDTGIVVPVLDRDEGFTGLAELGRRNSQAVRVVVGERSLVDALVEVWGFPVRLARAQLAYTVDRSRFRTRDRLPLRTARVADLDPLTLASAAMAREEAGDDPYGRNPKLFRSRIRERIHRGRDFVFTDAGELVFKCNVSALSDVGGQIEGIYTVPAARRRGLGRRGTAAVTSWVLERTRRACLLVNEDNHVAKSLYLDLGYREAYASRTVFFQ
jgi:uncharacterized protein